MSNAQKFNYENRVVQAHKELQQFFKKFENDADQYDNAESGASGMRTSLMDDLNSERDDLSATNLQKSKEVISAKTMLE